MLQSGTVIDRKYKILSEVGHGGMSVVYLAINERANKTWAVKEVRKDGVINYDAVKQGLIVETDMLKRLSHPHLPSIVDVIDTEDSFLIVMDYVEGRSLQNVLNKSGAQPPELVVNWGEQICDVLGYLHTRKPPIIYRDMKPANLMLRPDGNLMLIDFGTAREFKNRSKVEDTTCLGTRGYAAPEQFGGYGETDPRTDIYCTGATLYHLLTGHSPAEPPYEIKPLSYWNPAFAGSGLEKVVDRCCRQDPNDRYQSCEELLYALQHISEEDDAALRARNRKWRLFLAGVIVCLAGAVGMLFTAAAKNGARDETYSYYMEQAKRSDDFSESLTDFKKAMQINPAAPEAYEELIALVANGGLNAQEDAGLTSCFREANGSTVTNLQHLQAADPETYAKIMYQTGILYFFLYDNSANSLAKASSQYFSEVLDSPYLTAPQQELADGLYKIGSYYGNLGEAGYLSESTYMTLWNDLCEMVGGNVAEKVGGKIYSIALYRQMAYQIDLNCEEFNSNGVTQEEMTEQLDQTEAGLNGLSMTGESPELQALRQQALDTVSAARGSVRSYFDRKEA